MARKADYSEKLTEANLDSVIEKLSGDKPITKKLACELLGINYNTTRLDSLLEAHKKKKEFSAEQRAKKRYTPASKDEIDLIISAYLLDGDPISSISKRIYRSDTFVSGVLDKVGCPKRVIPHSYFNPGIFPDICVSKDFNPGDKVYSARYDSSATIKSKSIDKAGEPVYLIWLNDEKWQQFAYQPWWELASLEHLKLYCSSI